MGEERTSRPDEWGRWSFNVLIVLVDWSVVCSVLELSESRGPRVGNSKDVERGALVVSSSVMGVICVGLYEGVGVV